MPKTARWRGFACVRVHHRAQVSFASNEGICGLLRRNIAIF
jgi:hypothetical protein